MPTLFNINRKKGVFMIPSGGTSSGVPPTPSFTNTKSLNFDGVDDYIDCGTLSYFTTSQTTFSISFWFKQTTVSGRSFSIGNKIYFVMESNRIQSWILGDTTTRIDTTSFVLGTDWHNFTCVFDGSGATDTDRFKVWIDGVPNTLNYILPASTSTVGTSYRTSIANGHNSTTHCWNGSIDEVAVWDSVISIGDIWDGSGSPINLVDTNPIAWYRMGDSSTYQQPQILMPSNENKNKVSNYSMAFDGVDDVITLSSSIINASEFSISIWIKPDGFSSSQIILGNGASSNNWIHLSSTTLIRIKIDTTLMNFTESGGNDLIDGVWQHLLIYRDSSNNVGIYRNGVAFSSTQNNTDTLELSTIGKRGSLEYLGNIDEVAFWNTDESSSVSSIYNSGTPSTISGATAYWKLGEESKFTSQWLVPNSALSNYSKWSFNFDGVDDVIDCGVTLSGLGIIGGVGLTSTYTLSCWVKFDSLPVSLGVFFGATNVLNQGLALTIRSNSRIYAYFNGTSFYSNSVSLDTWYHVVFTDNGTNRNLYINGALDTAQSPQTSLTNLYLLRNVGMGSDNSGTFDFNGNVDEACIYTTALTPAEILDMYNSGQPKAISGAVAHWRMGEDSYYNATTSEWNIPDQIGSNDGTSNNLMAIDTLVGEAPNYSGGGTSSGMTIEDREGNAPNSDKNSLSYNMYPDDIETDTP